MKDDPTTEPTKVGSDLVELAERLAQGERLCATTGDEAMRRDYQDCKAQLARAVEFFKIKLGHILASTPILTPELREWALKQATDAEIIAGLHEVREKGGSDLGEVIQKLKQKRKDRERELDSLEDRAAAAGYEQQFHDALDKIYEILRIYPQYGDTLREYEEEGEVVLTRRSFTIPPLFVQYILDEPNHRVFILTPFKVLPRSGFE